MTQDINKKELWGYSILNLLHKEFLQNGIDNIRLILKKYQIYCKLTGFRVLCDVLMVFHSQVSSWTIYGVLVDFHKEFFVQRRSPEEMKQEKDIRVTKVVDSLSQY